MDAPGCPTCARNRKREAASSAAPPLGAPAQTPAQPAGQSPVRGPEPALPDLQSLSMKDYHRVVRATYSVTEGTPGGSRLRAYLPFALLVLLLIAGAAVIFGHMP
jgi:hypothetical protein